MQECLLTYTDCKKALEGEVFSLKPFLEWLDEKAELGKKGGESLICIDTGEQGEHITAYYLKSLSINKKMC